MAAREHRFRSTWHLPAAPEAVWGVLADPTGWSSWWPGLRSETVHVGDPDGVGTRSHAVFPSPLGYRLNLGLEVLSARAPHAVVLRAVGDLAGTARSTLEPDGARGTVLRIDWHVRLTSAALTRMDRIAPWIADPSHAVVMRAGERGLRRHLLRSGWDGGGPGQVRRGAAN
ncbi:SRPBCC family protein [Serinibacter arcticus]|uniref:Coenzyme Q-binding protein COQ10 START domain-containing protein n=1 Tax=Serinibacter arcticus TaxID=1655435 RepID=A0A4Z1E5M9_9MICO|nr:SRPBCC family protein [Serinibacter arcticus]TGO06042.1 hypothetical protein SERN_0234 [Serinibacter arcticus]